MSFNHQFLNELDNDAINTTEFSERKDFCWRKESDNLLFFHLNIRSINKNFDQLMVLLQDLGNVFDVIALTETWHTEQDGSRYSIPGYDCHTNYCTFNRCDGVTVFTRTSLSARFEQTNIKEANAIKVSFASGSSDVSATVIYRPPSCDAEIFLSSLADCLEAQVEHRNTNHNTQTTSSQQRVNTPTNNISVPTSNTSGKSIHILIGDINLDIMDLTKNQLTENYLQLLSSFAYHSAINKHTRVINNSKSCLDHIFTTEFTRAQGGVLQTSITDHYVTLLNLNVVGSHITSRPPRKVRVINQASLTDRLALENWFGVLDQIDPEVATNNFIEITKSHIEASTSIKQVRHKEAKLKPWITRGLIQSIRHRDKLFRNVKNDPDNLELKIIACNYRVKLSRLLKTAKVTYYKNEIASAGNSSAKIWRKINDITSRKQKSCEIKRIRTEDGRVLLESESFQMAETFNSFFAEIGNKMASQISVGKRHFPPPLVPNTLTFSHVDENEVAGFIKQLKTNSAAGLDGLQTSIFKNHALSLLLPITHVINLCFVTGVFPTCLKTSVVIPILKSGNKESVNNYRPISLTPVLAKIVEKAIKVRLDEFLEENKYLMDEQYGFRRGRNTVDPILKLAMMTHESLDNGGKPLTIFLDLRKAFDTVAHDILLEKLNRIGVRGRSLQLLSSYLKDRKQCVRLNQAISNMAPVTCGIPQGTVLGPIFFNIYINDLSTLPLLGSMLCFADDTALHYEGRTWSETFDKANKDINLIKEWLDSNKLTLNIEKTNYIAYSCSSVGQPTDHSIKIHQNNCPADSCDCPELKKTECAKYLGVLIDQRLRWDHHTRLTAARLRKAIYVFKRLRSIVDKATIRQVYFALVQSVAQYATVVWGGAYHSYIDSVSKSLNIVLRVALHKHPRYPTKLLYKELNVPSIYDTYVTQIAQAVVKNQINLPSAVTHSHSTRSVANQTIPILRICKTLTSRSPQYIASKLMNILPEEFRTCIKLSTVKFKKFLSVNPDFVPNVISNVSYF